MPDRLDTIIATHRAEIEAIRRELAQNYDQPAQRIINAGMRRMNVQRFTRHDDVWEQIVCRIDGEPYEAPPTNLMQRWASY